MEALVLSFVIHVFLAALTLLHWRTLNPTEEALPYVPLPALAHTHMCTDTHIHTHNSSLKLLMACFHEHILFPDGGHE